MTALIVEVARRNGWREDVYIRPSFYKSTQAIGVKLHGLEHELYILTLPFGNYVDVDNGIKIGTVSWRRTADTSIPSRAKIVGSYVNPAFSKTEAMLNGFDEALVLTESGHASEGSAENLFIIRDGVLITPPVIDDILEGITRAGIMEMAARHGHPRRRALDRPDRALHRRRGLPLRHRRPALAGDRGRPSEGRQRRRSGRSRAGSRTATSTSSAAACPSTATG